MSRTQIFRSLTDWQQFRRARFDGSSTLGFVPTMGALHRGHGSLVERCKAENDFTLASIFVNPTQFNNPDDLAGYPKTLDSDLKILESVGCDFVLLPEASELYHDQYHFQVRETALSRILCGAHRPGHFDGVLTVVLKLLSLSQANRAYFGEKDYQQLLLIREMAQAFFLPTEIVACPTVREGDGLAMSSRNLRLSPPERTLAAEFARVLRAGTDLEESRSELERLGFRVDYLDVMFGRRFGAVHLGEVRLIDNVEI